jgi:ectoine hydroxylase-related dioxygenase (phytanoyl-CoA dioxygenase family)
MASSTQLCQLGEQDVEAFQTHGVHCLRGVFDRHWLDAVGVGIQRNINNPGPYAEFLPAEGAGRFFNDYCNWKQIPEFRDFVTRSPAAHIAAQLMGSKTSVFYHEHVLVKEPGALKPTPWHHDQPYYPIDGIHICSIWMPIDPVPVETSLVFVSGSHKWGRLFVPRKFSTSTKYQPGDPHESCAFESVPDIDGNLEDYEILTWPLEPGDCIVFHRRHPARR